MCIWENVRIPTVEEINIARLKRKLEHYRSIWRGRTQRSASQIKKQVEFQENLFDIPHVDALQLIKIPEDYEFLNVQHESGHSGFMAGVDKVLTGKQEPVDRKGTEC